MLRLLLVVLLNTADRLEQSREHEEQSEGQSRILEDCFDEVTIAQVLQIADRWPARLLLLVVAVPKPTMLWPIKVAKNTANMTMERGARHD